MQYLTRIPEYYLIAIVLLSGYSPPFSISPFIIPIIAILIFQVIYGKKATGLVLAGILSVMTLYFLLALISEFNEFPVFNSEAQQFLFVGLAIFVLNLLMAGAMIFRYSENARGI